MGTSEEWGSERFTILDACTDHLDWCEFSLIMSQSVDSTGDSLLVLRGDSGSGGRMYWLGTSLLGVRGAGGGAGEGWTVEGLGVVAVCGRLTPCTGLVLTGTLTGGLWCTGGVMGT